MNGEIAAGIFLSAVAVGWPLGAWWTWAWMRNHDLLPPSADGAERILSVVFVCAIWPVLAGILPPLMMHLLSRPFVLPAKLLRVVK